MAVTPPATLVDALSSLPRDVERGFRFRGLDGSDRFYPWPEVEAAAREHALRLWQLGLRKGDRLAVVVADPQEFVLTFLGAVIAGIVPVPIYPRASFKAKNAYVDTVAHIVSASGARMLITLAATRPVIEEVLPRVPSLEAIVLVEDLLQGPASGAGAVEFPAVGPQDLCFLQFTSGSTSMPKGVRVTHRNLVSNAWVFLGESGINRYDDDTAVTWLPLYHDMGLIGFVLGTIIRDINTVLLPTEAFARRPSMWMQAMHDYCGTITFAPNFAYALAVKRARDREIESLDLSRVRVAGCGAEPINPQVMRAFAERFAPAGFRAEALMPAYGMAEATLAISFHPCGTPLVADRLDAAAMKAGRAEPARAGSEATEVLSCGPAFEGHEIRILDEHGNPLPERHVGQIATRGPSITERYHGGGKGNSETFVDGWLRTGDLGYLADGNVHVCGRLKDLIIVRGANFYPQDIEWAVSEVEGVRRDNVVAFSVMRNGEEGLVIAAEGNSKDAPELRRRIATRVAEACGLSPLDVAVVRVGSLPKTSSGKVMRRKTKAQYEAGELEEHGTSPAPSVPAETPAGDTGATHVD